jgi:hypothetical protein
MIEETQPEKGRSTRSHSTESKKKGETTGQSRGENWAEMRRKQRKGGHNSGNKARKRIIRVSKKIERGRELIERGRELIEKGEEIRWKGEKLGEEREQTPVRGRSISLP